MRGNETHCETSPYVAKSKVCSDVVCSRIADNGNACFPVLHPVAAIKPFALALLSVGNSADRRVHVCRLAANARTFEEWESVGKMQRGLSEKANVTPYCPTTLFVKSIVLHGQATARRCPL